MYSYRSYGLVCPMHGPFCHKTWSVLSLTGSVLSCGGPFCPWSVLSMVRYVPNSSEDSDVSLVTKFIAFSYCIILIPCDKQYFCRKNYTHLQMH